MRKKINVGNPTLTSDVAKIVYIRARDNFPSHKHAFGIELDPNSDFKMVLKSILMIIIGLIRSLVR